jgi:excisionase family DNA binding protein
MIKRLNQKKIDSQTFYTVKEVAYFAGCGARNIRKHVENGKIQAIRLPGKMLVDGGELMEFLRCHVNG